MHKKTLLQLSHFTTLLFGIASGMTLMLYLIANNYPISLQYFIILISTLLLMAIIFRLITINIFKKYKIKFNSPKK